MINRLQVWLIASCLILTSSCAGAQSAISPAGEGARRIFSLTLWMVGGATVIWCVVIGLAIYAIRVNPGRHDARRTRFWVIGGGVVAPTILLTVLLIYGLSMLPELVAHAPQGSREIEVIGHQWWWQVRYHISEDETVELANEIRLPVDEPVQFRLQSQDVIHSFWIAALGGKVDMVPGRTTWLTLQPTKTGTYRGVCAEYCGASHAFMAFNVIIMEQADFDAWLDQQRQSAVEPRTDQQRRGQDLFLSRGCSGCHAIRGTAADGAIAPDLTHLASRTSIGAGILKNSSDHLRRWISATETIKPEVKMPSYDMLKPDDRDAIVAYLEELK